MKTSILLMFLVACAKTTPTASAPDVPLWQPPSALLDGTAVAVAYSGYREGQHPDRGAGEVLPTPDQAREDLGILVDHGLTLVRMYDAGAQTRQALRIIRDDGLPVKVVLGAWLQAELSNHEDCAWLDAPIPEAELAANRTANAAEVDRAIALVAEFPDQIVAVNVGNEALVRWNDHLVSIEAMVGYLEAVGAAVDVPVSTADNYVAWAEHAAALGPVADFAMVHTYPQWEGRDVDTAMPFTLENLGDVRAALPDIPMVIGEAGWASEASEFGERASPAKQRQYVDALTGWAADANVTTFVFEAFDEPWKGDPDNPAGAEKHWGLFTVDRRPKSVIDDGRPLGR